MDIRILKYFIAVAQEKNISKAAQKLFISQPALSKQLRELEEELNVVLFKRGSRNITLTDEGLYLLSQANEIILLMDKTINNISINDNTLSGEIFIGAGESKGIVLITKVIKTLLNNFPNIKIHFFSGDATAVLEKLENGTLDFGLLIGAIYKKNFDFIKIPHSETLGILTTKDGIFSNYESITTKDLENIPLMISNQMSEYFLVENLAENNFSRLNIIGTYNLLYNASLIVEAKIGHAICLDGIINTDNTNLKFIPFKSFEKIEMNLIWKKNLSLSKACKEFLKLCIETFK